MNNGVYSPSSRSASKCVVVVSSDAAVRGRLRHQLTEMRWNVLEASGGAEAISLLEDRHAEALMVDHWLPDLEVTSFSNQVLSQFPEIDLLGMDGSPDQRAARSARRNELLHALREVQNISDGASWNAAPEGVPSVTHSAVAVTSLPEMTSYLPGVIGNSQSIREVARLVRLVAPRKASVLIEGETGTGKELIAHAVHLLSARSSKPFVVLNCAAIPESLLEAELFGHSRGAFTGAVQSRTGRIEAADGGTLFLDEIGEMPVSLQAKLLRFLENGELQRVGENEPVRVDVRLVAATHQPLERRSEEGAFRLDLYHRLAVFPIYLDPLRERMEDLPMLVAAMLEQMGKEMPRKSISLQAMQLLQQYHWPGNIRELGHVLQRAAILTDTRAEILPEDIRLRRS